MSDQPIGINAQNAGLFSSAAYTPIGKPVNYGQLPGTPTPLPVGWSEWLGINPTLTLNYPQYSDTVVNPATGAIIAQGNNEFRVFINPTDRQIVIAFKGTTPTDIANITSDLTPSDEGTTQYADIMNQAQEALITLKAAHPNYQIFTDGHSLGGEMAQAFALKNGLNGFGQNSLPIAPALQGLNSVLPTPGMSFNTAMSQYKAAHSFTEVYVAGDPATEAYSEFQTPLNTGGEYLSTTTIELASPYLRAEEVGADIRVVSAFIGDPIIAAAASKAHAISTVNRLAQQQLSATGVPLSGSGATVTVSPAAAQIIGNHMSEILRATAGTDGVVSVLNGGAIQNVNGSSAGINPSNSVPVGFQLAADEGVNEVLVGGSGNDTLNATNGNDTLIAGTGNDVLYGGSVSDTLIGGAGNATLVGGAGNDTFEYIVPTRGPSTVTTITDTAGTGTVQVGTTPVTGGALVQGSPFTWADANGTQYVFAPGASGDPNVGTLAITQGLLGNGGDQIVIEDFNLNVAQTNANGDLGIKFAEQAALSTDPGATDPFLSGNYAPANANATVAAGAAGQSLTLNLSAASDTAQQVTLNFSGSNLAAFSVDTGAHLLPISNGTVTLTVPAGMDNLTVGLVATLDLTSNETLNVTATLPSAPASNALTVNFAASGFTDPLITNVINGSPDAGYTLYNVNRFNSLAQAGNGSNPFLSGNYAPPNATTTTTAGAAVQNLTINLSAASDTAQQVTLTGADTSAFAVSIGAGIIPISKGIVNLTVPAGMDSLTVGLVPIQGLASDQTLSVTAALSTAPTGAPASNSLTVNFTASGFAESSMRRPAAWMPRPPSTSPRQSTSSAARRRCLSSAMTSLRIFRWMRSCAWVPRVRRRRPQFLLVSRSGNREAERMTYIVEGASL